MRLSLVVILSTLPLAALGGEVVIDGFDGPPAWKPDPGGGPTVKAVEDMEHVVDSREPTPFPTAPNLEPEEGPSDRVAVLAGDILGRHGVASPEKGRRDGERLTTAPRFLSRATRPTHPRDDFPYHGWDLGDSYVGGVGSFGSGGRPVHGAGLGDTGHDPVGG